MKPSMIIGFTIWFIIHDREDSFFFFMRDTLYDELKEKNALARSSHSRVSKRSKYMLPSDYLSASEKRKMNGEITMYEMQKPISWEKFKGYPREIQKEYIQWFVDEFEATASMMGEVFGGKHSTTIINNFKSLGFSGVLHRYSHKKAEFAEWLKQFNPEIEIPVVEPPAKKEKDNTPQMFFNTISSCEMNLEGAASQISQTLFNMFRDQRIAVTVVFTGATEIENE